jgi:NTP pyrophosphatase (non-canonical NTP hydrolase)
LKIKKFAEFVSQSARIPLSNLTYSFVGLGGEAGECLEWFKKNEFRGDKKAFDDDDLLNELGDVVHYVTRIALQKGWTLQDVMQANVDKLKARHGNK